MTDVNDRTNERYEPEWDGEGPPPPDGARPGRHRRLLALRIAAAALGAGAAIGGVWALWGAPAAAILAGIVLLRAARLRRRRRWMHHGWMHPQAGEGAPRPGHARRFHLGCWPCGAPFRQPMV